MTASPNSSSVFRKRLETVSRRTYPRLLVSAHRLITSYRVHGLECADLCQDGLVSAVKYLYGMPPARSAELDDDVLKAIFFVVAARTMRGRLVDHLRRRDVQRRGQCLAIADDRDQSFVDQQRARLEILSILARLTGAAHSVLTAAIEIGDIDPEAISARCGLSKPYVYKSLQIVAEIARSPSALPDKRY